MIILNDKNLKQIVAGQTIAEYALILDSHSGDLSKNPVIAIGSDNNPVKPDKFNEQTFKGLFLSAVLSNINGLSTIDDKSVVSDFMPPQ
ncbi:MAG: hypothetical protein FJX71_03670 [Alphaproteobacteria bacterium]|nr:hypothetical protein [Alphaproteobacteria bacterium]